MLNEVELSILNLGYQIAPNATLIIFCIQLCIRDGLGKSLKKKQKLYLENNQLFVPHLPQRKGWGRQKGAWRINWGCGIQRMRSCQYPERGLTCAGRHGSFLLPLLFSRLYSPISTEKLIPFSLLQLEVEMKVLKSRECTAEQSAFITKEEVDTLRWAKQGESWEGSAAFSGTEKGKPRLVSLSANVTAVLWWSTR